MGLNFFFYLYSGSVQIFINYDTFPKDLQNYYWSFENSYSSDAIYIPYRKNNNNYNYVFR